MHACTFGQGTETEASPSQVSALTTALFRAAPSQLWAANRHIFIHLGSWTPHLAAGRGALILIAQHTDS